MSKATIKATVMWACLDTVNDMSGKYQVDLTNLSDGAVDALEALGISVGYKEDRGSFITCKSKHPIVAKGEDGEILTGVKIGNGSTCIAVVKPYEWTFKGKAGVSGGVTSLHIQNLEVYEADDDEDFDIEEAL